MSLDRYTLDIYGEFFFSDENMAILDKELQIQVFRKTGYRIGVSDPDVWDAYRTIVYKEQGRITYKTEEDNIGLLHQMNSIVLRMAIEASCTNILAQQKLQARRNRPISIPTKLPIIEKNATSMQTNPLKTIGFVDSVKNTVSAALNGQFI